MAEVCQTRVFLLGDFLVDVLTVLSELVHQSAAEVGRVGYVGHLVELLGQIDSN